MDAGDGSPNDGGSFPLMRCGLQAGKPESRWSGGVQDRRSVGRRKTCETRLAAAAESRLESVRGWNRRKRKTSGKPSLCWAGWRCYCCWSGCFFVLRPFMTALMWAMILAYSLYPHAADVHALVQGIADAGGVFGDAHGDGRVCRAGGVDRGEYRPGRQGFGRGDAQLVHGGARPTAGLGRASAGGWR